MFTSIGAAAPTTSVLGSVAGSSATDADPVQSSDSGESPGAFDQQFDAALAETAATPRKGRVPTQSSDEASLSRDVEGNDDEDAMEPSAAAVVTTVTSWQALRPLNVASDLTTADPQVGDASSSEIASVDPEAAQDADASLNEVARAIPAGDSALPDGAGPGFGRAVPADEPQALDAGADSDGESATVQQEARSEVFHDQQRGTAGESSPEQSSRSRRGAAFGRTGEGPDQAAADRFDSANREQLTGVPDTFGAPKPNQESAQTSSVSASPDQGSTHQPNVVVPTSVAVSATALEASVSVDPVRETPDDTPDSEFPDRLVQSMRLQALRGGGEAIVQIRPEHLGPVTVSLRLENGTVSAQILAADPRVVSWLNANHELLREGLLSNGMTLDRLVVDQDGKGSDRRERRREPPARPRYEHSADRHSTFELTI